MNHKKELFRGLWVRLKNPKPPKGYEVDDINPAVPLIRNIS